MHINSFATISENQWIWVPIIGKYGLKDCHFYLTLVIVELADATGLSIG